MENKTKQNELADERIERFFQDVALCLKNGSDGFMRNVAICKKKLGADYYTINRPILISGIRGESERFWILDNDQPKEIEEEEYTELIVKDKRDCNTLCSESYVFLDYEIKDDKTYELGLIQGPRCGKWVGGKYKIENGILKLQIYLTKIS